MNRTTYLLIGRKHQMWYYDVRGKQNDFETHCSLKITPFVTRIFEVYSKFLLPITAEIESLSNTERTSFKSNLRLSRCK